MEKRDKVYRYGIITGFITMYIIFTLALYFIINFFKDYSISFFFIANITLLITLLGNLTKILLKA